MKPQEMVPVTILTGFLGSGKTTLLNRILKEQHGRRIAVIENEFGEAGIDNELLVQDTGEQIVEMNNGCICCTVRGDLVRILGELQAKREAKRARFRAHHHRDHRHGRPRPGGADFFHGRGHRQLLPARFHRHAGGRQARATSSWTISARRRSRWASPTASCCPRPTWSARRSSEQLKQRLVRINPRAPIKQVHFGETPLADILDIRGFNLNAILEIEPGFLEEDEHEHDDAVHSFVFRADAPFDGVKLEEFLSGMIQVYGPDLLRYKGVLWLDRERQPGGVPGRAHAHGRGRGQALGARRKSAAA